MHAHAHGFGPSYGVSGRGPGWALMNLSSKWHVWACVLVCLQNDRLRLAAHQSSGEVADEGWQEARCGRHGPRRAAQSS
eukprot:2643437-Alexandrium_andersonii.AAC.1